MRKLCPFLPLLIVLVGTTRLNAQQFWENQRYQEWSLKNCEKMLNDSPWALTIRNEKSVQDTTGRIVSRRFTYIVQIRSALPIRQAIVRQAQIKGQYDQMNSDQKKIFDAQAASFLTSPYADRLVFDVQAPIGEALSLHQRPDWPSETAETLKDFVVLIGPGDKKIPLMGYSFKQQKSYTIHDTVEFEFTFPKQIDGHPLIDPGAKTLKLEFRDFAGWNFAEFSVPKMMLGAELVY